MFKVKITEQAFQPVTQGENVLQPALKKLIILIPSVNVAIAQSSLSFSC